MTLLLSLVAFTSLVCVHAQQNDKGTSMIPFPRIGRSDPRFFMEGKRSGNSPGLIPFPRIGRSDGFHELKRNLIPFPRVGKRPYWHLQAEPYPAEFEEYTFPMMEVPAVPSVSGSGVMPEFVSIPEEQGDAEKRSGGAAGSGNNNNGGMWFGPRLGRRKRSVDSDSAPGSIDARLLLKILHNFNWAIVPLKERRNFTPRLGRSSSEETSSERSEPYTPRLGRSRELLSGDRDTEDEGTSRNFRITSMRRNSKDPKGQSDETTLGGVPFSPRLGRDHINPRLGRSSPSADEHE